VILGLVTGQVNESNEVKENSDCLFHSFRGSSSKRLKGSTVFYSHCWQELECESGKLPVCTLTIWTFTTV
jgi:hypothetical protein